MAAEHSTSLAGQVAIVTGSGRGIGRAIALAYANAGAQLVIAARSQDQIDSVRDEISAAGGTAIAVRADVTNRADVTALVAQTLEAFGRLDIVVANAGATSPENPVSPIDDFAYVVDVNLTSVQSRTDLRTSFAGTGRKVHRDGFRGRPSSIQRWGQLFRFEGGGFDVGSLPCGGVARISHRRERNCSWSCTYRNGCEDS